MMRDSELFTQEMLDLWVCDRYEWIRRIVCGADFAAPLRPCLQRGMLPKDELKQLIEAQTEETK